MDIDEEKSRLLNIYNPFVIRFAETEIKKGYAILHLKEIVEKIAQGRLVEYYRNWMTGKDRNIE